MPAAPAASIRPLKAAHNRAPPSNRTWATPACRRANPCPDVAPARHQDHFASTTHSRSEEHTSELQSLMRISYAVFCLKKKKSTRSKTQTDSQTLQTVTRYRNNMMIHYH